MMKRKWFVVPASVEEYCFVYLAIQAQQLLSTPKLGIPNAYLDTHVLLRRCVHCCRFQYATEAFAIIDSHLTFELLCVSKFTCGMVCILLPGIPCESQAVTSLPRDLMARCLLLLGGSGK